ncbi:hypothetical protein A33Q_1600 [Indibacter alkaliphilus LW1]|uniref:Uncharacterized protein n=1 Tax=Indibacter alkaliphilus (strain CCUG 57479 / KCTC 22604 / LW1) TaxID=1189612 RepID=S2E046_INDAL|nr:hypothetical protein A33Q_1600 [Indibacter alkaliphilus LW1]
MEICCLQLDVEPGKLRLKWKKVMCFYNCHAQELGKLELL